MPYVRMEKSGLYVFCDYVPEDGVEVSKEEYDEAVNPTPAQIRKKFLVGSSSARDKKEFLFRTLTAEVTDDGEFEEIQDLSFYQGMTVDEMTLEHAKYLGDDDERASLILDRKRYAKGYIRSLVESLNPA